MCQGGVEVGETAAEDRQIVPDRGNLDENDSAFGDDAVSETTSISSWIKDYRVENGRTYHAFHEGKYCKCPDHIFEEERKPLERSVGIVWLVKDNLR